MAGGDGAIAHLEDAVEAAEVGGVVRGHHDREGRAFFEEEAVDDFAARLVEGRVRFVEQEDFRALDDGAGDERALELAAGQGVDRAFREFGQAKARQRQVDGFVAVAAFLEPSVVGVRTHLHQAAELEREVFGELRALREVGDTTAAEARGLSGDERLAGADRRESGEHPEQGRFAGAIGADERGPAAAGNFESGVVEREGSVSAGRGGELLGEDGDAWAAVLLFLRVRYHRQDGEDGVAEMTREGGDDSIHLPRRA